MKFANVLRTSVAFVFLPALLSGCGSASVESQPALAEQTSSGESVPSGATQFLGREASLLQPGSEGQAAYRYVASGVQWSTYTKVMIQPVQYWDSPDSAVSPDDQKMLCSYFYNALQQNLEKNFTIVSQPGPGVAVIQAAIINATAATPGLRSISVVVPQARILNYAQSLATGHAAFAGSAESAMKITDGATGQLLAEWIDQRMGGMSPTQAAQLQWGDAESAMDYWAKTLAQRAAELGAGTPASGGTQQPTAMK